VEANVDPARIKILQELARKVLWLASWMIHHANHIRPSRDGIKVGGHQASSASLVALMTALYFDVLRPQDRVAVKPHASPVYHAIQYLLGKQPEKNSNNFAGLAALNPTHRGPKTSMTSISQPAQSA
jgi:pyruvate dehydrogenase E1 component